MLETLGMIGILKITAVIIVIIINIMILIRFFQIAWNVDSIEKHLHNMEIEQEEQTKLLAEIAGYQTEQENNIYDDMQQHITPLRA